MAELETTTNVTETVENVDTAPAAEQEPETTAEPTVESAEIARLRAELAKQKSALDKATKEAADNKKALRARQSAEEAAAEEKREADEAMQKELNDLRKRFAVAETTKKVMSFISNEASATSIAEYLYGAEDADAALTAIGKEWSAREKALRMEFGKIPAPGVGGTDGPTITKEQLDAMKYAERAKFANEHPEEYNKLMGR